MTSVDAPYDLAGPAHDVDTGDGPPGRSYLLCSMPRSGSSLLSEGLHATGRLGTPIEYLDRSNARAVLTERWGATSLAGYLRLLHRHRTTPEGLFGAKLHWFHLADLTAELVAEGLVGADAVWRERRAAALDVFAPNATAVLLTRRDHVRQAVSWFVADRTGRWSSVDGRGDPTRPVAYEARAIERRRRLAAAGERAWSGLLSAMGVDVAEVAYEDLVVDYEGVVRSTARHLGVDLPVTPLAPPRLRRQADDRTEELVERFRAEWGGADTS